MAVFAYIATDHRRGSSGGAVSGTVAADTPRQARDLLRSRGLRVQRVAAQAPAKVRAWSLPGRDRSGGGSRHVGPFARNLSTLLGVGVPLAEALGTAAGQYAGRFRTAVLLLRERVSAGASLAEAMREQPAVFDELCVNLTAVGEDAGTLDASLRRLAEFAERSRQLGGKLVTSLIYPGIVLVTAVGVSVFLMSFVVPAILQPLVEQGRPLPLPTRAVKAASDALVGWWWAVLLAWLALAGGFGWVLRTRRGRRAWDGLVLRLPVLGDLVRKQAVVRIAVVVGTLLGAGVEFVAAVRLARRATGNVVLKEALAECEAAVESGGDVGRSLAGTAAFPPLVVQVFALGQQSGRLEEMLERLAADYDAQVSVAAARLAAALEPVLILLLGGLVLAIALATMLPILEAGDVLG